MGTNIYNASHALDTTAKEAIDNADRFMFQDKKAMEFVSLLHNMAKAAGYIITAVSYTHLNPVQRLLQWQVQNVL